MARELIRLARWLLTLCALPFLLVVFVFLAVIEAVFESMESGLDRKGVCNG